MVHLQKMNFTVCELSLSFCKMNIHPSLDLKEADFLTWSKRESKVSPFLFSVPSRSRRVRKERHRSYIVAHCPLNLARMQENSQTTSAADILGKVAQTQYKSWDL